MRKAMCLSILVLATAAIGGCGGSGGQAEESTEPSTALQTTTAQETTTAVETTASGPGPDPDSCPDDARYVSSQSNIFGAGGSQFAAPAPGGGGGGEPPQAWKLPASATMVTFPFADGEVTPIASGQYERELNGPGGDGVGPTNIESYGGISGLVHGKNGMFLTGVFLGRKAPADPAPPRLDFSKGEKFKVLSPKIGQTFFIGDGRGRTYRVPAGATRLFLGFVDGAFYQGMPGYYSNNAGGLCVQMEAAA